MKNKYASALALLTLAVTLSLASHATAGQVTIINKTQDWNCYISAKGYFLGIPTEMKTPCALPGKTEWFHTSLSVGNVAAHCVYKYKIGASASTQACDYNLNTDYVHEAKNFIIDGIWLPHRNFTVTVTGNQSKMLHKYGDMTFTLKEN
ncbi:hypothetical protein SAMN02745119_02237 [Trichlorobacter thiogenes]|uniref:Uncharacterized protein n=1 Tax=Trichlorobacter thiogenes TaxID=115783 RepID=A0A1T4Q4Y2_9BACT|nr:hypothetical protein [Trichlorobacter thiogenes]SJZ98823.1 hypothetical protein SAMN02745119_02237 [Trichlorobacter thiogenes]